MMFHIHPSTDHTALARMNESIHAQHVALKPGVFKPYNREDMEREFEDRLSNPEWLAFIALQDNCESGYVLVRITDKPESVFSYASRTLYVDQLYVDEAQRGQGIGKALIEKVLELAKSNGIQTVQLDHWSANEEARGFFGKMGFTYYQEKMEMGIGR